MSIKNLSPSLQSPFLKVLQNNNNNNYFASFDPNLNDSNKSLSFRYDPVDYPLKSTQQLNVDWSKFENHTFFSSAKIKINEGFNKIINSFPFDGTKIELNEYVDSLTGFEKWLLDSFPTFAGALHFSGTNINENPANGYMEKMGTWIEVVDKTGYLFPTLSRNTVGERSISAANAADKSFTIEMHLLVPKIANKDQIILQKVDNAGNGFTLCLKESLDITKANIIFTLFDSSDINDIQFNSVEATISKGKFSHICVTLNVEDLDDNEKGKLEFYVNSELYQISENRGIFNQLSPQNTSMFIGSGSTFYSKYDPINQITPLQTFSGSLDELRIFDSYRNDSLQYQFENKGLHATSDLKLYYRFNEPFPLSAFETDKINSIVLDSSGNSLHSYINNFTGSLRVNVENETTSLLTGENDYFKKVLFPGNSLVQSFNQKLLYSGTLYDDANPNLITRLIPEHYFIEGAMNEGYEEDINGNIDNQYGGNGIPGQGKIGSTQVFLSILNIWAKFFDEMKMFADSFGTVRTISYDENSGVPDNFLEDNIRKFGFFLPRFFANAQLDQFAEGENIENFSSNDIPLKKIQALLMRRVLMSLPAVARSKGTLHSIKVFLRSLGIDPDNSLSIREFGNSRTNKLSTNASRDYKKNIGAVVNMQPNSLIKTTFLSGSRVEPGYPQPKGQFTYDIPFSDDKKITGTTQRSDGLFTSGSWTIEGIFKIPKERQKLITESSGKQCLFRLHTTGSLGDYVMASVIATPSSLYTPGNIKAYIRTTEDPAMSSTRPPVTVLSLNLTNGDLFNGEKWNISIGRKRNDEMNAVSSSYFLRVGQFENGEIVYNKEDSTFYHQNYGGHIDYCSTVSTFYTENGPYIAIGSQSLGTSALFVNPSAVSSTKVVEYVGQVSNLRFWSKALTRNEWLEHVKNFKSIGVENPIINCDYESVAPGSFEKLRLNTFMKQPTKIADNSGEITFIDFSSTNLNVFGTGFDVGSTVVGGDLFEYSQISSKFDEISANPEDKIRIMNENSATQLDDLRLAIEFSLADSLDEDIIKCISSSEFISNALGNPELQFSSNYFDIENLREIYFKKLNGKLDFRKYLEFYRWFDISISTFIEQLLPMKTRYRGTNFVVESHMLERNKFDYKHSSVYVTNNILPNNLFDYSSLTMK